MQTLVIKCKIVAKDEGQYTTYIVEDLNREYTDDLKYVSCVKLPNWNSKDLAIGDIGYLQCRYVEGGISEWYDPAEKDFKLYKYTNCYFINFIKTEDEINNKEFDF